MTPDHKTGMTPEAQRIAVAEACGWNIQDAACPTGVRMWTHPKHPYGWRADSDLPNYPADLNAMHEAEKVLTFSQRAEYAVNLQEILGCCIVGYVSGDYHNELRQLAKFAGATAAHRCEAFLRTIGRWEE